MASPIIKLKETPKFLLAEIEDLDISGDMTIGGDLTVDGSSNIGVDETITGELLLSDGSASSPSYSFVSDIDLGFYRVGANTMGISSNGSKRFSIGYNEISSAATNGARLNHSTPTSINPGFTFVNDTNTGVGRNSDDELSLIAGGTEGLRIDANELEVQPLMTLATGAIEFEEDSGAVTAMNMPVTSTPSDGDEMSMSLSIDSNPILKIKASANGTGGADKLQLQSFGGIVRNTTNITDTYSLLASDDIILVTLAAAKTITIPTAQAVAGRTIVVKDIAGNAGTYNITIATEGAETIDGSATTVISGNYDSITMVSDGINWFNI